ncbi:MAG: hypothetical protein ACRDV9_15255 [Acidimicrobiia bacterium]
MVLARHADGNRVRGLTLRSIAHGIAVFNSDRNRIENNSAAFAGIDMNGPCRPATLPPSRYSTPTPIGSPATPPN